MMQPSIAIILTQHFPGATEILASQILYLTAEERTRSRHRFTTAEGQAVFLQLPRGTVLQDGDRLRSQDGFTVQVVAKPEPVITVTADDFLSLLQAAYHLGNRHVPVEITPNYLRLLPDPVLQALLQQRGLKLVEELRPFFPEPGAYGGPHH